MQINYRVMVEHSCHVKKHFGYNFAAELFRAALLNANIMDDVMKFEVSPPWSKVKYTSIYICKAYKEIHAKVKERNCLILGNPGIGKSYFAVYLLYNALKDGRTAMFHSALASSMFLFKQGETAQVCSQEFYPHVVLESSTLYLYDSMTKRHPYLKVGPAQLIVFTAPCLENVKDFVKAG